MQSLINLWDSFNIIHIIIFIELTEITQDRFVIIKAK